MRTKLTEKEFEKSTDKMANLMFKDYQSDKLDLNFIEHNFWKLIENDLIPCDFTLTDEDRQNIDNTCFQSHRSPGMAFIEKLFIEIEKGNIKL